MRDVQKPLPLPVKGSTPECIAWAGIAEAITRAYVEKEWKRRSKETWAVSLSIYPRRDKFLALLACNQMRPHHPSQRWSRSREPTFAFPPRFLGATGDTAKKCVSKT
jgi:hypothetical protein